jgi:hypothetical protein
MKKIINMGIILIIFSLLISGCVKQQTTTSKLSAQKYEIVIDSADFTASVTNKYFNLPIGKKMVYESETKEGLERIEILIPGWKREVMGVQTLVFWDRVYLKGELIEDTRDYIAQHKNGDVWYFGEHVDNYEGGILVDHEGAWLSGIDGAMPGILAKGQHAAGDSYRQEYYKENAEDMARTISINENVSVKYGNFTNCIKTFEWSPLFEATTYKYNCAQVGGTVLEEDIGSDGKVEQRAELIEIDMKGALGIKIPSAYTKEGVVVK